MTIEIIAEIGVNHNGSVNEAEELLRQAHACGVDTVKFQYFQGKRYPGLQLTREQLVGLREYAKPMSFLCTPDTFDDAKVLREIGVSRIKIGSCNLTNIPLLDLIAEFKIPVILSTGAGTDAEVLKAFHALTFVLNSRNITLMHCVSAYPAPFDQLNLRVLSWMATKFPFCKLGYSDHTMGYDFQSALIALGLGATVFEKHFTLNNEQSGPDHQMSANPDEMKRYVDELRKYDMALGSGNKHVMPCEMDNREVYEKFVKKGW